MSDTSVSSLKTQKPPAAVLVLGGILVVLFLGLYSSTGVLGRFWRDWLEPEYQHAFLVPIFAGYLLWRRQKMLFPLAERGTWWCLVFFALSVLLQCAAILMYYPWLGQVSVIPGLVGLTLLIGGWRAFRWAWPALFFLCFMIRLPRGLAEALSQYLQSIGTKGTVFLIQTLGIPAMPRGNVIILRHNELNVIDACSGLKMMMLFFTLCVGAVFVIKNHWVEKAIIIISAIPIAVISNVFRLSLTAVLYEAANKFPDLMSEELANKLCHDGAGLFMMPIALLLIWAEMAIMSHLFLKPVAERSVVARGAARGLLAQELRPTSKKPP
ncbi:MAG: exosortase/archaeosortase family protein [Pirellulales bacterium]|nr:exosortase/archaeosortase family protein [Pirellulales bacterium]